MKSCFFLDMDDTLLDFGRAEKQNLIMTLNRFQIPADMNTAQRFHEINEQLWKALERGEIERKQIVVRRFEILLSELGETKDVYAIADGYYMGLAEICYPFAGMTEFLSALRRRGRIFITTNGGEYVQRRHLKDAGILPFTDGVFISDEIGANKPSQAYADAVKQGVPAFLPQESVYVGDSLTSDKICAERMGIEFILYAPNGTAFCKNTAKNYAEILALIDSM